jgi:penicillin-binding protein 2
MTLECLGKWKYLDRFFRCHNEKGHGWVNLNYSLIRSCDIYYYKVGDKLGIDRLARYARMLGGGRETGIDLSGELAGLIPTPEWKRDRYGVDWLPGETLNTVIGQGSVTVTPIQLACMYAVIANGGTLYRPQIVQRILGADGAVVRDFRPVVMARTPISSANFARVRRALMLVVNDPAGTAYKSRMSSLLFAGKTGTSQVRRMGKRRISSAALPYEYRDHAWFACFAPWDNPSIVVVVLCEHAGHGASFAAPIARQVLVAYQQSLRRHQSKRQADQPAGN